MGHFLWWVPTSSCCWLFNSYLRFCSWRERYAHVLLLHHSGLSQALSRLYLSHSPLPFTFLLSSVICKASLDNHLALLHFFFFGVVLVSASYTVYIPPSLCLQSLCLPDLIPSIYSSPPLKNHKRFDLGHTWRPSGFPCFLEFKPEFCNKELMIWATVRSRCCSCWLYSFFPSSAAKNIINLISVLLIWWCPCVESSLELEEKDVCYDQSVLVGKLLALALINFVLQGQTCQLL